MTKEPPHSCPHLDAAIREVADAFGFMKDEIERARSIADDLRTWGGEWKDRAEELERENASLRDELNDAKNAAERLERLVAQLEAELERTTNE